MMKKKKTSSRVRLCVEANGDVRFYDLTYPRLSEERLERVLTESLKAFAQTFNKAAKEHKGVSGRWCPRARASVKLLS